MSEASYTQLRGFLVHFHVLWDENGVTLIDGGFIGGVKKIEQSLQKNGFEWSDVKALILTHGHLDHTLNLSRIQSLSGCRVYAPRLDEKHVKGVYPYKGWGRVCGLLEAIGRFALRYRSPVVDTWFDDGEVIPVWGGLEVVSLPGHTLGHSGLLSEKQKLLFAADLFTNHLGNPRTSPTVFNVDNDLVTESVKKAAAMNLEGVLLNHSRVCTPEESLRDLLRLGGGNNKASRP